MANELEFASTTENDEIIFDLTTETEEFITDFQWTETYLMIENSDEVIFELVCDDSAPLVSDFGEITERDVNHEYYTGAYTVAPKVYSQSLPTTQKVMEQDVEVKSIPFYEVNNKKGTTVYIGDDLNG